MAEDWIYGVHALAAALESGEVDRMWVARERLRDHRIQSLVGRALQLGIVPEEEAAKVLSKRCHSEQHQGVLARALPQLEPDWQDFLSRLGKDAFLLVLDGVQDPRNLGACLRSAEAAGVHGVILPKDNACGITGAVRKAAAGAASRLPVLRLTNLVRAVEDLQKKGYWVAGLAGDGAQSLYGVDLRGPLVLVLGNEEKGIRRLLQERCDYLLHIPMFGPTESLNVSVAAGIALFEARRQRLAGEALPLASR